MRNGSGRILTMQPPSIAQTKTAVAGQLEVLGIGFEGWLTLIAVLLGPIIAVQLQKYLERRREAHARKLALFRELMATRTTRLSPRHVEALNTIEIEFVQDKATDKPVLDAWRLYLDSLGNTPVEPGPREAHFQKREDLFVDLLFEIGRYLGFKFDKVAIRRNAYSPIAHGEIEDDQRLIRKGVVELLSGKRALSTLAWLMPPQAPYPVRLDEKAAPQSASSTPPAQQQPLVENDSND